MGSGGYRTPVRRTRVRVDKLVDELVDNPPYGPAGPVLPWSSTGHRAPEGGWGRPAPKEPHEVAAPCASYPLDRRGHDREGRHAIDGFSQRCSARPGA